MIINAAYFAALAIVETLALRNCQSDDRHQWLDVIVKLSMVACTCG